MHDLKTDEEREKDNADQGDDIKSYRSTPTETTVKVDTALTITRKSLRERKPKSSVESAKTKPGHSSFTEQLFQDLNLKVGLLEGHHDDACAVDLCGNFVVSGRYVNFPNKTFHFDYLCLCIILKGVFMVLNLLLMNIVFLPSYSRDTSLKLWIASSREELKSLGGHDAAITGVCFMRDKPFSTYPNAVTASYDCSLRVWDLEKGTLEFFLRQISLTYLLRVLIFAQNCVFANSYFFWNFGFRAYLFLRIFLLLIFANFLHFCVNA